MFLEFNGKQITINIKQFKAAFPNIDCDREPLIFRYNKNYSSSMKRTDSSGKVLSIQDAIESTIALRNWIDDIELPVKIDPNGNKEIDFEAIGGKASKDSIPEQVHLRVYDTKKPHPKNVGVFTYSPTLGMDFKNGQRIVDLTYRNPRRDFNLAFFILMHPYLKAGTIVYENKAEKKISDRKQRQLRLTAQNMINLPGSEGYVEDMNMLLQIANAIGYSGITGKDEEDLRDLISRWLDIERNDPNKVVEAVKDPKNQVLRIIGEAVDYGLLKYNPITKTVHLVQAPRELWIETVDKPTGKKVKVLNRNRTMKKEAFYDVPLEMASAHQWTFSLAEYLRQYEEEKIKLLNNLLIKEKRNWQEAKEYYDGAGIPFHLREELAQIQIHGEQQIKVAA